MASSSSSEPSGGDAAPLLAAATAGAPAPPGGGIAAPSAGAAVSPDLAHIRQINDTNAWGELLKSDVKSVALTEPILVTLLGLSLPRATMLIGELAQVGVDTIGTLLTAAEDIRKEGGAYVADGKLSPIDAGFLQDIAALRDKVRASEQLTLSRLLAPPGPPPCVRMYDAEKAVSASSLIGSWGVDPSGRILPWGRFDPFGNKRLTCLIPTPEQVKEAQFDGNLGVCPFVLEPAALLPRTEDANNGVRPALAAALQSYGWTNNLEALGGQSALVTSQSKPDLTLILGKQVLGVAELKAATDDISVNGAVQAAGEAANIAVGMVAVGMAAEHVVVPFLSSNGHKMQFFACAVLEPNCPTWLALSRDLDLTHAPDNKCAVAHLHLINEHAKGTLNRLLNVPRHETVPAVKLLEVSEGAYFFKKLTARVLSRGMGLLVKNDGSVAEVRLGRALSLHLRVMTHLFACAPPKLREQVVFPCGMRMDDDAPVLIYENVASQGFVMGVPHNDDDADVFVDTLKTFVTQLHNAGVWHLDLYPSNLFWRAHDKCLRVVDWDAAHQAKWGGLMPDVKARLAQRFGEQTGESMDNLCLSTYEKLALQKFADLRSQLAPGLDYNQRRRKMDEAFFAHVNGISKRAKTPSPEKPSSSSLSWMLRVKPESGSKKQKSGRF